MFIHFKIAHAIEVFPIKKRENFLKPSSFINLSMC